MVYSALIKQKKNSVPTTIISPISAVATSIPVNDLSVFYDSDGVLITSGIVIGYNNTDRTKPEEITITGASGTSGPGNLTGATRGVNADGTIGQALAWSAGTSIAVMFSIGIFDRIRDNLSAIYSSLSGKLPNPYYDYKIYWAQGGLVLAPNVLQKGQTTTNANRYTYAGFTDGGTEEIQFDIDFPDDWNGDDANLGKISFQTIWTAASGAGTFKADYKGKILADGDPMDVAQVTIGSTTDTLIAAGDQQYSPWSTPAVISQAGTGGKSGYLKVTRDSATDTLNATAQFIGVRVKFIRTGAY